MFESIILPILTHYICATLDQAGKSVWNAIRGTQNDKPSAEDLAAIPSLSSILREQSTKYATDLPATLESELLIDVICGQPASRIFERAFEPLGDSKDTELVDELRALLSQKFPKFSSSELLSLASLLFHSVVKGHVAYFHERLDSTLSIAKEAIDERRHRKSFELQCSNTASLESLGEGVREILQNQARLRPEFIEKSAPKLGHSWNRPEFNNLLVAACLLGSWSEGNHADCQLFNILIGSSFSEVRPMLLDLVRIEDSLLSFRDGVWSVRDRLAMFEAAGYRVSDANLERFKEAAQRVLVEKDPALLLPQSERVMAKLTGDVPAHSEGLKREIAVSLAILGGRPELLEGCTENKAEGVTRTIVRKLLEGADWHLWGSLDRELPFLAEAAPLEFINAVEKCLLIDPSPFTRLYGEENSGVFGRNYLVGLLWALETAAWDPELLSSATVLLGKLAEIDPGGNSGNRASASLATIFTPWLPQSIADESQRAAAIRILMVECPDVAWKLLFGAMPSGPSHSNMTYKPRYRRTIPSDWKETITNREYANTVRTYASFLVDLATGNLERISELVRLLGQRSSPVFDEVIELLRSDVIRSASEEERAPIWQELTGLIRQHRNHADASWALPAETLDILESLAQEIGPSAPEIEFASLFAGRDWELYDPNEHWEDEQEKINSHREGVVRSLLEEGGLSKCLEFADAVESPFQVGAAVVSQLSSELEAEVLPGFLIDPSSNVFEFARGVALHSLMTKGWDWVDQLTSQQWTSRETLALLLVLPFEKAAWSRLNQLDQRDRDNYWNEVRVNPYTVSGDFNLPVSLLMEHGRHAAAANCLYVQSMNSTERSPPDSDLIVQSLLGSLAESQQELLDPYQAVKLIVVLQGRDDVDKDALLRIEWAYLPLLDGNSGATPLTIEMHLASNPPLFVELLSSIYRADDGFPQPREKGQSSEHDKRVAESAFKLLYGWATVPGYDEEKKFEGSRFEVWVRAALELAQEKGFVSLAQQHIGQVLIHSPADEDGLFLHRSVCGVLNQATNSEMRVGFEIATRNSRGMHAIDRSGAADYELAESYREKAALIEVAGFHRLAMTFRNIADSYDAEGDRNRRDEDL